VSTGRSPGIRREWRVPLPAGVGRPFEVYVNGVRQELGVDFQVRDGELVFERELVRRRTSRWAWLLGAIGIGTYGANDDVDVRYVADGRPAVAHGLAIIAPAERPPLTPPSAPPRG
jgi:hypothetical protein